ncbi:MAG: ubiquitin-like small modifier protein 1 [Myxococcota bacterium]
MRISFYATLRKIVGQKHIELPLGEDVSLREILSAVVEAYPDLAEEVLDENGELDRYIHLFVNGRSSKFLPDGMETRVDGSQTIEFFPAVAGG